MIKSNFNANYVHTCAHERDRETKFTMYLVRTGNSIIREIQGRDVVVV